MENISYLEKYYEEVSTYLKNTLNLSFLSNMVGSVGSPEEIGNSFYIFLKKLMMNEEYRSSNELTYEFLKTEILDYLVDIMFINEGYIRNKLISKESQLTFNKEDYINIFTISLILKDIFYIKSNGRIFIYNEYMHNTQRFEIKSKVYLSQVLSIFTENMPNISEMLFSIVAKSAMPYKENDESVSTISRLIAIFDRVSKIFKLYENNKNSKSSKSQLVSMFYQIHENANFFGFDKNITAELLAYSNNFIIQV